MLLTVDNVWTQVSQATPQEEAWLFDFLSMDCGKPRFFRGKTVPPPKLRLYSLTSQRVPSGVVPTILQGASMGAISVVMNDRRICPAPSGEDISWLGSDARGIAQQEVVATCLDKKRGIIWAPTGSGKTNMAIGLVVAAGGEWLFLVPDVGLLNQTAERWEGITGVPAGVFGDGVWREGVPTANGTRLSVATYQTLYKNRKLGKVTNLLQRSVGFIGDEFHTAPADTFSYILSQIPGAYRIGMSGTPLARGDKKSLLGIAMTGPIIARLRYSELAEAGVLSKPKITMRPCLQIGEASRDWHSTNNKWIVASKARNDVLCELAKDCAKPALLFVNSVKHGVHMAKMLRSNGIEADFVWGKASSDQRETAIKRLVRGDTQVLVCSTIFQQGVDIPSLASVIVGGGGASTTAAIQRVGRGMRTDGGTKMEFQVWDVLDQGVSTIARHSRERRKAYLAEGYEVIVEGENGK